MLTLIAALALVLLILFSELSAASFRHFSTFLRTWPPTTGKQSPAWTKVSLFSWAFGGMIPLLSFSLASLFLLKGQEKVSTDLILGAMVGSNTTALGLLFGLALLSGPLTFFRIRTMSSPLFLFFATFAFVLTCLDNQITFPEAVVLCILALAYAFYFRTFSSDWKYYQRNSRPVPKEFKNSTLPGLAFLCMGLGFFLFAFLLALPLVYWITTNATKLGISTLTLGTHIVALLLLAPWIIRLIFSLYSSDTQKSIHIMSITHTCLLNILLLPSALTIFGVMKVPKELITIHLPVLLVFTVTYVATLLIQKQQGKALPIYILLAYSLYTVLDLWI